MITGALGYVGSHIAVLLSENSNFNLFLIDNFENSSINTLKNIKFLCKSKINFFEMDIRNSLTISDLIKSKNIKTIIHCAGLKSVKNLVKGKFFDIEVGDKKNHLSEIEKISKDLLANPIIENFKIVKK